MNRTLALVYGVVAYVTFLIALLYAIGFVASMVVPKAINDGVETPATTAALINIALLALFAIQHTIMARPAFKRWWTRYVPPPIERSTYVLLTNLILMLMFWQWRPMTGTIWHVEAEWGRWLLYGVSFAGWALMIYATFVIDHFDLFGLRQVWLYYTGRPYTPPQFQERTVYRVVRHPLMLGFLVAFWATPDMTAGHLLFAAVTTGYILVGTSIEERDLLRFHGEDYKQYRRRTSMLLPIPKPRRIQPSSTDASE